MKIVLWLMSFNLHTADTINELQKLCDEPLTIIVWKELGIFRRQMGWETLPTDNLNIIKLEHDQWWKSGTKVLQENPTAFHVFWGFWTVRAYFILILTALSRGLKVSVANEPYSLTPTGYNYDGTGWVNQIKAFGRPLLYKGARFLLDLISKDKKPCVFPLSLIAKEQFLKAGFQPETLYPFGYFVNKRVVSNINNDFQTNKLRLIFVGNVIKRKGIDIAITAVQNLYNQGKDITLDLYGAGQIETYVPNGLDYITYKGMIPNSKVQETIAKYDMLILPSRHDGWGVVVNEALLQGIPVVVSDQVGAKCLVENMKAGVIFKSGDSDDLRNKLLSIINNPDSLQFFSKNAEVLSPEIFPDIAAQYFIDSLRHYFNNEQQTKPENILWCKNSSTYHKVN